MPNKVQFGKINNKEGSTVANKAFHLGRPQQNLLALGSVITSPAEYSGTDRAQRLDSK